MIGRSRKKARLRPRQVRGPDVPLLRDDDGRRWWRLRFCIAAQLPSLGHLALAPSPNWPDVSEGLVRPEFRTRASEDHFVRSLQHSGQHAGYNGGVRCFASSRPLLCATAKYVTPLAAYCLRHPKEAMMNIVLTCAPGNKGNKHRQRLLQKVSLSTTEPSAHLGTGTRCCRRRRMSRKSSPAPHSAGLCPSKPRFSGSCGGQGPDELRNLLQISRTCVAALLVQAEVLGRRSTRPRFA